MNWSTYRGRSCKVSGSGADMALLYFLSRKKRKESACLHRTLEGGAILQSSSVRGVAKRWSLLSWALSSTSHTCARAYCRATQEHHIQQSLNCRYFQPATTLKQDYLVFNPSAMPVTKKFLP